MQGMREKWLLVEYKFGMENTIDYFLFTILYELA